MIMTIDKKMSCIERIRFFHHEYLDALQKSGGRLHPNLRRQCLLEVGIAVDENTRSEGLRKYDSWFQLAFRSGEIWELQDRIFSMWEWKEVKGQWSKKEKLDRMVSAVEHLCVGYYDAISKKKARAHINERNVLNYIMCPTVTNKLRHVSATRAWSTHTRSRNDLSTASSSCSLTSMNGF